MTSHPGNTEPQLGAPPSPHRGWYSRGYLPHCDHPGLLQAITYRLADSLPAAVVARLDAEVRSLPPGQQDAARRQRVDAWLDAGHGSCVLRHPDAARCVVDTWQHFAGERYDLIAWVVMPNHVHLLIRTYEGVTLAKIVQSWKSYTGRRIREMMEAGEWEDRASARSSQGDRAGARSSQEDRAGARSSQGDRAGARSSQEDRAGARSSQEDRAGARSSQGVWMREYWDRYIRDERHFQAVVVYIHQNPVKAGLVGKAEDWPWSSAREFSESAGRTELGLGDPERDPERGPERPEAGRP